MTNFEKPGELINAENVSEQAEDSLNHLLENEGFMVDSEGQKDIEDHFDEQLSLKERLEHLREKINPKVFSSIKLGLKIFLISKMIGAVDVQAQSIEDPESDKDKIEHVAETEMNQEIKDSTFVIEYDNLEELNEDEDREKISSYLKEIGMDNVNFHTKDSKLFGQYSEIHSEYREFADENPAFLRFGSSLYSGLFRLNNRRRDSSEATNKMIPVKDSIEANKIAEELYIEFCEKHDVDPAKQLYFNSSYGGSMQMDELDDTKFAFINVGEVTTSGDYYNPTYVTAMHEINHLQRVSPDRDSYRYVGDRIAEALDEIPTKINEVINKDYIYKKINNIPLEEEVQYPEKINSDYNEGVSIGLVANTFRKLLEEYETVEECLMSPEGEEFVKEYYKDRK